MYKNVVGIFVFRCDFCLFVWKTSSEIEIMGM